MKVEVTCNKKYKQLFIVVQPKANKEPENPVTVAPTAQG